MNSFHPGAATYWTAADSVDTDLSFFRFLELYRTDVPERGMPPLGVVEALDVVERLMKRLGLQGVRRGKVVRTTISGMLAPARWIGSTASSGRIGPTSSGYRTSPTFQPGKAGCTWPL